jgi:hypothetical protein
VDRRLEGGFDCLYDPQDKVANLASTYRSQGWWNDAEKLQAQVLEQVKAAAGNGAPRYRQCGSKSGIDISLSRPME